MKITESKLREIIREELGISCEVINMSNEVLGIINENLPLADKNKQDNFIINKGFITFDFLGNSISLSYQFYNFLNKDYYALAKRRDDRLREGWSVMIGRKKFLAKVTLCGLSGTIDKESALEVIYHELEHIYQQIKMASPFDNDKIYVKMRTDMGSQNEMRRNVANFFYTCIASEQEGFINGLYGYLMSLPIARVEDEYKKSDCYQKYAEMTSLYKKIFINNEGMAIAREYKLTPAKAKKCMKNFLLKICRCIAKAEEDKIKYQGYRF